MIINNDIRKAIKEYLDTNGMFNSDLAKKIELSPSSTLSWINGKASSIRDTQWKKLYPLIKPYLPDKYKIEEYTLTTEEDKETERILELYKDLDNEGKSKIKNDLIQQYAKINNISVDIVKKLLKLSK